MKKRIGALVVCIMLCFSMLPFTIAAEELGGALQKETQTFAAEQVVTLSELSNEEKAEQAAFIELGTVIRGSDTAYYRYIPEETMEYILYNVGDDSGRVRVNVYDQDWVLIQDKVFFGRDYSVPINAKWVMEAGKTYYFELLPSADDWGDYMLTLNKHIVMNVTFHINQQEDRAWFLDEDGHRRSSMEDKISYNLVRWIPEELEDFYYPIPKAVTADETLYLTGWSLDPAASEPEAIRLEDGMHVYAVWQERAPVTFYVNSETAYYNNGYYNDNGEYETVRSSNYQVMFGIGETITRSNCDWMIVPEDNKAFIGWAKTPDAEVPENIVVDGPMDVYAVYGDTILVTYHTNREDLFFWTEDGDGQVESVITRAVPHHFVEQAYYFADNAFDGWATDPNAEEGVDDPVELITETTTDLYAIWQPLYSITFNCNHPDARFEYYDDALEQDVTSTTYTMDLRKNYRINAGKTEEARWFLYMEDESLSLAGWALTPDADAASIEMIKITEPVTLYAIWDDGACTHQWKEEYTVDKPATCTEKGIESLHCAICDEIKPDSEREIEMIPHTFGDWFITKSSSYEEPGEQERKCEVCGFADKAEIPQLKKIDVSMLEISAISAHIYTGKNLTPAVTVKNGSTTLVKNTDYTVEYTANKAVGTAKVTIKGKGNYSGTVTKTFEITKAANPLKTSVAKKTVKVAKVKKAKQTVAGAIKATKAQGKVTYTKVTKGSSKYLSVSKTTGKITVKKGTPKGTHKIKVAVKAAGNGNYKAVTKTVTAQVQVK